MSELPALMAACAVISPPAVVRLGEKVLEKGADKMIDRVLGGKLAGAGVKSSSRGLSGGKTKGKKMKLSALL